MPDDAGPGPGRRHLNPVIKLAVGAVVGVAAIWLVVSTAGGVSDAVDAVSRMRPGFVALAVFVATVRIGLYGLQILSLGRRTGPLTVPAAAGLALVVFGFGAITPASPAEGLAIAATLVYRAAGTLLPVIAGAIAIPVLRSHRTPPGPTPVVAAI